MRDFFKGWRRKVGCVVLSIALLLIVEMARSVSVTDLICLRAGRNTSYTLASESTGIVWVRFTKADGAIEDNEIQFGQELKLRDILEGFQMMWQFEFGGVRIGAGSERDPMSSAEIQELLRPPTFVGSRANAAVIPHWLIALPLTLLSALLLLWPQRKRPT